MRQYFLGVLTLFAVSAPTLHAQNAHLSGHIEDSSGASVPKVSITVLNVDTGIKRTTLSNDEGIYTVPSLPPGLYKVSAQVTGFQTVTRTDVRLEVEQSARLDFKLEVGTIEQTITVQGGAPMVNTENAAVSTVVDRKFVENMPLNGRSFQSLITLTPGVVLTPAFGNLAGQGQFSVNGQRADANSFTVDGVSANAGVFPGLLRPGIQGSGNTPVLTAQGTTQSLASIDAMQEFRVQTSTYSAEFGRQPGAQISIVTRSGTNALHGSVFDYLRNDVFDANDWFLNANHQPKPPERQNDFGGTLGGPVIIPGLYNGHNHTFFFFSYEGLRLRLPQFALMNVPTLALRQNAPPPIQPLLRAFPLPNGRDLGNGLAEQAAGYSDPSNLDSTSVRVDHSVGNKTTIFGRYSRTSSEAITRGSFSNLSVRTTDSIITQTATLGVTTALSARSNNEFRFNYTNNDSTESSALDDAFGAVPISLHQIIPSEFDSRTSGVTFQLFFSGVTMGTGRPSIGLTPAVIGRQRQVNIVNNFSHLAGAHRFRAGVDYRLLRPTYAANTYRATAIYTSQQQVLNNASDGSFGSSTTASIAAYPTYTNISAYVQDNWKLFPTLTLDLGVRWDVNPAPGESNGNDTLSATQTSNVATMQLAPYGTALWKTAYNNLAPRLGVAYLFGQRTGWETILSGGFGVFFDTGNNLGSDGFKSFPFKIQRSTSLSFPLSSIQAAPPSLPSLSNLPAPYGALTLFDPHLRLPYTLQWNIGLQQSLGAHQIMRLSYVGASGRRLLQQRTLNLSAINPSFTTVALTTNSATSDYHALEAQFQRQLSRGLQALASYTWSHALDFDSFDNGTIVPVRGNAGFDVRHNLGTALTYDIPSPSASSGHLVTALLGHWGIDNSIHAQTALPVDLIARQVTNPLDGSLAAVRPFVVPGPPFYVDDPTVPGGWRINRSAFSIPATGQFGNLGRNAVRGFGAWQVDLALRRQFRLTERASLQFRGEAFNLFNHPNFGSIATSLTAANFGQATSMRSQELTGLSALYQIGGPRSLQFALKVGF